MTGFKRQCISNMTANVCCLEFILKHQAHDIGSLFNFSFMIIRDQHPPKYAKNGMPFQRRHMLKFQLCHVEHSLRQESHCIKMKLQLICQCLLCWLTQHDKFDNYYILDKKTIEQWTFPLLDKCLNFKVRNFISTVGKSIINLVKLWSLVTK
jgi:hypothetical protein